MINKQYNYNSIMLNKRFNRDEHKTRELVSGLVVISLVLIILAWFFITGLDRGIANQDIMLCESARTSGNAEYLEKCDCYYQTDNIKCLQGK